MIRAIGIVNTYLKHAKIAIFYRRFRHTEPVPYNNAMLRWLE